MFFSSISYTLGNPSRKPIAPFEAKVLAIFEELLGGKTTTFEGVHLSDLPTLEPKLQLNINVFELVKEEDKVMGKIVQCSH